jgi:hypothetical protein
VQERFETQRAAGKKPDEMEFLEVVENDGIPHLRYMKPVGVGAPCLHCHGTDINAEVKAKIDALYPNDQATGYRQGDIRGAFSISSPL